MNFASLCDQPVRDFAEEARKIPDSLERLFGRSIYCNVFNPTLCPENLVFALRPARQTEINTLLRCGLTDQEKSAVDHLTSIVKTALPAQITNFRFARDPNDSSQVYLVNDMGEKSASRPLGYFAANSRHTLWKRCWDLGNFCYHGSNAMIGPFINFCLS